jgi:hypothetical protein
VISQILEKIVNYRLSTIPNSYDKIEDWVKQGTTFGTSVLNVVWRTKIEYSPVEGTPEGEEPEMEGKVVKDAPDFEVPNILDVYYNPVSRKYLVRTLSSSACTERRSSAL